jgi:urea carboxylase
MAARRQRELEVLEPGIQSTVQDYPGRLGHQARGFFPAGPMDAFAFRAANLLAGNAGGEAGIESALGRFAVRFACDTIVALAGAPVDATLNDRPLPLWESASVKAGDVLRIGVAKGPGFRVYLAVAGGIDVPAVLGSRATYTMGALGGHEGRALKKADRLRLFDPPAKRSGAPHRRFRAEARPSYKREWRLEVMRGPQADPDFLTAEDAQSLFERAWNVGHNSNRVGVRLATAGFAWARKSGGDAGGHPSNILDNGYPVGGVNLNGDMPVILGPDGPTAGGFVVVATVVHGALWKLGQLRPGSDVIRFQEVGIDQAVELARSMERRLGPVGVEEL